MQGSKAMLATSRYRKVSLKATYHDMTLVSVLLACH